MTTVPSSTWKNIIPVVSDHALLRFLERSMGIDVEATRREIVAMVTPAINVMATAWSHGGVTFKFKGSVVVTVTPNQKPSEAVRGALMSQGRQPSHGPGNRREAHQFMRRRKW